MLRRTNRPNWGHLSNRERPALKIKLNNRLLPLITRRIINQHLRTIFLEIFVKMIKTKLSLTSIQKLLRLSVQDRYLTVWSKIISFPNSRQKNQCVLRNLNMIVRARQRQYLAQAFVMIDRHKPITYKSVDKIFALNCTVEKMLCKRKHWFFQSINYLGARKHSQKTKCKIMLLTLTQVINKKLFGVWTKTFCSKNSVRNTEPELQQMTQEIVRLNKQIVQSNSEKQIIKMKFNQHCLQEKIKQSTDILESATNNEDRNGVRSVEGGRRGNPSRFRSVSRVDRVKEASDNITVMSWLEKSLMSYKSGKSSDNSVVDSSCQYKQKLNKYKLQANSYKRQLQILQNELEVTKDINEHMQQEMISFCQSGQTRNEMEALRVQSKLLKEEREGLHLKIIKYQKYIANLKYEFKTKIQSLHRSIKNNQ